MTGNALHDWFHARTGAQQTGDWLAVDQDMINRFADLTGDHQWIHVDTARAARESPYGTTVAHGFLIVSLLPRLIEIIPAGAPVRTGINYGIERLRFTGPVRSGARIRGRAVLKSADRIPGGGVRIVNAVTIEVEGESKPACVLDSIVLFYA